MKKLAVFIFTLILAGSCFAGDLLVKNNTKILTATTPEGIVFTTEANARAVQRFFYVSNPAGAKDYVYATVEASMVPLSGWTLIKTFTPIGTNEAQYDTITDDVLFPNWRIRVKTGNAGLEGDIATPEATMYGVTY